MHVTKTYEFIGFGPMDVTKPYEFIGFGPMDVTKPYEFIGFGGGLRLHLHLWVLGEGAGRFDPNIEICMGRAPGDPSGEVSSLLHSAEPKGPGTLLRIRPKIVNLDMKSARKPDEANPRASFASATTVPLHGSRFRPRAWLS